MSDNLREQLARAMTAHHTVPWEEMPDTRKRRVLAYADAALAEFVGVPSLSERVTACVEKAQPITETAPVSVREAARVLCGSTEIPFLEPASYITKQLRNYGWFVPVQIIHRALRAIAEGKE